MTVGSSLQSTKHPVADLACIDKDASRAAEIASFPMDADGFPIIPEDHDMMRGDTSMQNASNEFKDIPDIDMPPDDVGAGGAGGSAGGVIVCPHCTFENAPGSVDCDICSLPLQG
jgi:nuclear protein localization family protein 4